MGKTNQSRNSRNTNYTRNAGNTVSGRKRKKASFGRKLKRSISRLIVRAVDNRDGSRKSSKKRKRLTAAQERVIRKRAVFFGNMIGPLIVVILIIIAVIAVFNTASKAPSNDLTNGVAYIKELESHSTEEVEAKIKEIRAAEMKEAFDSGQFDVWANFKDICIMGDSRAVGFSSYGFLEERWVLASAGATLRNIPERLDELEVLNPSYVVLAYGLNDISIGYWATVEDYIVELDECIASIHERVPNAKVFVNSTIPATDPAFNRSEKWRSIPDWNVAIKAHCQENAIAYIDINETVEAHKDLYSSADGIHMSKAFYPYWAYDILMGVMDSDV